MADKTTAARQTQWLRGVLDLAVLALLAESGEDYGYTLLQRLGEAGMPDMKAGTLYPLLNRLAADGLVRAEWRAGEGGPGRKFFALTDEGRKVLSEQGPKWTEFAKNAVAVVERGVRA
ncbi:PadR family transcriptional regulator [Saccharopolyspora erythraea NRRL 2338]|uniref:Transcriptional regulator, PadR-like family n=2 Tax=Saccharopolyspora erythraea TaxID=1836 RepID=A4FNW1_SACEN|nr:PadR family transcriptional regulator [Saccharopolyspora erythraea]EQD86506.1 PadR family transcripitonal regulator [Saccharopolyspora erythraea D]PFG99376.1 PadR family transcriptional regulator [Saccharopolyspora erythraea NRRL 2338]QRK89299.1 PadR family transcriptional regulator [Saccharopolyspora erythraea]CAM05736.1 transcriptional regulator, PadR-like family [Saccharopolyspora erythraea NRRL 2338]